MIELLPDGTILFQWAIFITAVLTLHFGIFRPTLRILNERKVRSLGEKETAKNLDEKSQEMLVLCEKRIEEARLVGWQKKAELRSSAEKFAEDLLKKTRAELQQKMDETRGQVESESREAAFKLRQEARDLSNRIATKVLEREI